MASQNPTSGPSGDLYRNLDKHLKEENYQNGILTANKLLKINPEDTDAIQSKVFALLNVQDFKGVVDTGTGFPPAIKEKFTFELAYAHYRLREDLKAMELLKVLPEKNKTLAASHLQAQVHYRLGEYLEAVGIYEKLAKSDDPEIQTNLLAALVLSGNGKKALEEKKKKGEVMSYEKAYNLACGLIDIGDLRGAEKKTKRGTSYL